MTEEEIRQRLCQVSVLLRRTQRQRAELDRKWQELVAERIQLQHALDSFEVFRATNPA